MRAGGAHSRADFFIIPRDDKKIELRVRKGLCRRVPPERRRPRKYVRIPVINDGREGEPLRCATGAARSPQKYFNIRAEKSLLKGNNDDWVPWWCGRASRMRKHPGAARTAIASVYRPLRVAGRPSPATGTSSSTLPDAPRGWPTSMLGTEGSSACGFYPTCAVGTPAALDFERRRFTSSVACDP